MTKRTDSLMQANSKNRRRFIRLFGTAAALLPITAIVGCSDDSASPPASSASQTDAEPQTEAPEASPAQRPSAEQSDPEPAAQEPMPSASESASSGDMPQVSLDDPTAKALGYKHDADEIDAGAYPSYEPGQICANCTLFQGDNGNGWGGCSLFPGKVVNANGWCSGYTPKPS